jgi:hypothetical protein
MRVPFLSFVERRRRRSLNNQLAWSSPQVATPEPSKQEQAAQRITGRRNHGIPSLNGLRVLLYPEQSKPVINVNITYLVGSDRRAMAKQAWRTCWST